MALPAMLVKAMYYTSLVFKCTRIGLSPNYLHSKEQHSSATLPFLACASFHHVLQFKSPPTSNVFFFSRAVSTSGATYLVTMACVCLVVRPSVSHRGTPPREIIGSQKFQNQNLFQLILSNFSGGGTPPPQ